MSERRSFFGQEVGPDGSVRRFFQDHFGGEDWEFHVFACQDAEMAYYHARYEDFEHEELRRRTDNFDPNTCDSRGARRELGDRMVNLGMKQNRIPSNTTRI